MKKAISLFLALIMCLSLCACGKSEAVKETEQAIKAIGKVTMSSQDAIEEASNLFDALTSEEQAKVSNRNDLSKAKDEFQGLVDYYIEIADRIVSAYTPQLGGAYKFTGEYLEDEKTYVVRRGGSCGTRGTVPQTNGGQQDSERSGAGHRSISGT